MFGVCERARERLRCNLDARRSSFDCVVTRDLACIYERRDAYLVFRPWSLGHILVASSNQTTFSGFCLHQFEAACASVARS